MDHSRWEVSELTKCLGDCGRMGYKILKIQCLKEEKSEHLLHASVVPDENCGSPRPPSATECFNECDFAQWKYSEWSKVS